MTRSAGISGLAATDVIAITLPQLQQAGQVIGFAGTDNKGLGGLEVEYNRNLTGKTGKQTIVRDPFGRAIDVLSMTPEQQGHDLFTTIDHTIQANQRGAADAERIVVVDSQS